VLNAVEEVLRQHLGSEPTISVRFVRPEDLKIFNGGLKLDELPRSWAHYALSLEPINPPVLVTQIELSPGEWLYIASLLPEPYT
ncbi:two-component sensor histidine kinase, partial [Glaciimonas sp. Cout2]|nr:two-component sensor histidine kinase [Glaciimonas sp. Cout2]